WLDVGFQTVQMEGREGMIQRESQTLAHVALACEGSADPIAHIGVLKDATDDLAKVHGAEDRLILTPNQKKRFEGRRCVAAQIGGERGGIARRCNQAGEKPPAAPRESREFALVVCLR